MKVEGLRVGQTVQIGQDIFVTVLRIDMRRHKVSLGITAPRSVEVHREEIWLELRDQLDRAEDQV